MVEMNEKLVEDFKNALLQGLVNTDYFNFVKEIGDDYEEFIKIGIKMGFIKCENELNILRISSVKYCDGKIDAKIADDTLILQKNFFSERNYRERKIIVFHVLFYKLFEKYFSLNNSQVQNFVNYLNNNYTFIDKAILYEALEILKVCTSQYLSQIIVSLTYQKNRKKINSFSSSVFFNNRYFLTDFIIYQEYEQLFIHFLKTLKNIENNEELFNYWFDMIQSGEAWPNIIGIYNDNKDLLVNFFDNIVQVKRMIEISESKVISEHQKYIITNNLIELDCKLKKQASCKNLKKELVTNKAFNI